MRFMKLLMTLTLVALGFLAGNAVTHTSEGAVVGAVLGLVLALVFLNIKTFIKGAAGVALVALIVYGGFNILQPQTSDRPSTTTYTLSSGRYLFLGPLVSQGAEEANPQPIPLELTNNNGEVLIAATEEAKSGTTNGQVMVGTLIGNNFEGYINDDYGRVEVRGKLTEDDRLSGMIYDDSGESIGPFVISR